jgi:hypothetical protein
LKLKKDIQEIKAMSMNLMVKISISRKFLSSSIYTSWARRDGSLYNMEKVLSSSNDLRQDPGWS